MEGWINVGENGTNAKVTKARVSFFFPNNSSDLSLDTITTVMSLLVFEETPTVTLEFFLFFFLCNLVASHCVHRLHRKGGKGLGDWRLVGEGWGGGCSLENQTGPGPALPWDH